MRKLMQKSGKIFLLVATAYLLICLALIYWPSQKPIAPLPNYNEADRHQGYGHLALQEHSDNTTSTFIKTATTDSLFVRKFLSDAKVSIVLLHGIAANSIDMYQTALKLRHATGAQVVTPDLRGHGLSGGTLFSVDYVGQYEDDLEALLLHLKTTEPEHKIILAGHSMGGGIALRYATKQSALIPDGYLLLAPNFGEGPTQRESDDSSDNAFVDFNVKRFIGIIMLNSIGIRAFDDEKVLSFNFPPKRKHYSYAAVMSAQPVRPQTSDVALAAIKSPLLVLVGSEDEAFNASRYPDFVSKHSAGKTYLIDGANHNGILTTEQTFVEVDKWFKESYMD